MFTVMIMLMAISPLLAFLLFIAIVARIARYGDVGIRDLLILLGNWG